MKTLQLKDLVKVSAATIFREKAPVPDLGGNVRALTIRDLVGAWPIDCSRLAKISIEPEMLSNCLSGGEVLMPTRGNSYPARVFPQTNELVFPYGQINIIYPNDTILGRYLAWYLNQDKVQAAIQSSLTGSSIQALVRQRLLTLEIEVPPLQLQEEIVLLQKLKEDSKAARDKLMELEAQEVEWTCRQLLKSVK